MNFGQLGTWKVQRQSFAENFEAFVGFLNTIEAVKEWTGACQAI
jgi:hypothetical protein